MNQKGYKSSANQGEVKPKIDWKLQRVINTTCFESFEEMIFLKLDQSILADYSKCLKYINDTLRNTVPRMLKYEDKSKFEASANVKFDTEKLVSKAMAGDLEVPSLTTYETVEKELSNMSEEDRKIYDQTTDRFSNDIVALKAPILQPDEKIEKQWFSYLESWFGRCAPGTIAFIRETNFSHHCFLLPGDRLVRCLKTGQLISETKSPMLTSVGLMSLAIDCGEALLKGIAGQFGAKIVTIVFPPSVPSYFAEVYQHVGQIVHEKLLQQRINEINGQINGFQSWLRLSYITEKESHTHSPADLLQLLQNTMNNMFIGTMGELTASATQDAALGAFLIAANVHLATLQELAMLDPNVTHPKDSAFATEVQNYAKSYAGHANTTYYNVLDARMNMIVKEQYQTGGGNDWYDIYYFTDSFTGYKSHEWAAVYTPWGSRNTNAPAERDAAFNAYVSQVSVDFPKSLGQPLEVIGEWNQLTDTPIPAGAKKYKEKKDL